MDSIQGTTRYSVETDCVSALDVYVSDRKELVSEFFSASSSPSSCPSEEYSLALLCLKMDAMDNISVPKHRQLVVDSRLFTELRLDSSSELQEVRVTLLPNFKQNILLWKDVGCPQLAGASLLGLAYI